MYIWERLRGLKVTLSVWARGQADGSQIVRSPTITSAPKKETLWAPEDIYPEGKRIETESLTDNLYDEQIDEVARKLKGERYLYLRGSNRVDEIFCRKEKGNMNWATWPSNSTELVPNTWRVPLTAERHFRALTNMFRIILATNLISRLWWMTW